MKRSNFGMLLGGGLILLGIMFLVEKIGLLHGVFNLFWGLAFLVGTAYFIRIYMEDTFARWWAIIPGMALLGMGIATLLPEPLKFLDGALFLGPIGLAFWIIYITDRARWWAIIPAGVLTTLAGISVLERVSGLTTGGLFFLGLGLTFLLVALLPNPVGKNQWAFIPGGILLALGVFLGLGAQVGLMMYFWPAALIVIGGVLIFFYFFKRE